MVVEQQQLNKPQGRASLFAIVGPGAIGVFLAARLRQLGHSVIMVGRHGPVAIHTAIDPIGKVDVDQPAEPLHWFLHERLSAIFLCVKAYDLSSALDLAMRGVQSRLNVLGAGVEIATFTNGWVVDQIKQHAVDRQFPASGLRVGITTHALSQTPNGYKYNAQKGQFLWGAIAGQVDMRPWEESLVSQEDFAFVDDIVPRIRQKWLANTIINTLTAYYQLTTNGQLLTDGQARADFIPVAKEAIALGELLWGPWGSDPQALCDSVRALVVATATNENSMYRDLKLGRPTESAWLAGLAVRHSMFPQLQKMHAAITAKSPVTVGS